MPAPIAGDLVNYVLPDGAIRPAIVVRVWSDDLVQLQQFTDQSNDGMMAGIVWRPSVVHGYEPGQWHFPERSYGGVGDGAEVVFRGVIEEVSR